MKTQRYEQYWEKKKLLLPLFHYKINQVVVVFVKLLEKKYSKSVRLCAMIFCNFEELIQKTKDKWL